MVTSLPSDVSKLLAVSEHTEEVEMTHVPVETFSVNPPSHGCTTLFGINSLSLDLGMANQVGQAASVCFADFFYQPRYRGFIFAASPLLLNSGLVVWGPDSLWFHTHCLLYLGTSVGLFFRFFRRYLLTHRFRLWDRVELLHFWLLDLFEW